MNERSLGFRWFFVFLLLTTFRGLREEDTEMVYLFDEPASNLHSTAQSQLLKSLEKLSDKTRVIYTTHSHHLINPDWLEQTFVVRNSAVDPATEVLNANPRQTDIQVERYRSFVASHPDQAQYFQPVLDVLQYQPSRLEMVADLVLVEGKNDYYALRLAQLIHKDQNLHFYPGGGAGSLDQVIGLYLAWGRNFVVLLDSDVEGERQKRRYIERFGLILEDNLFTLGDICEQLRGKAMEGAFSDAAQCAFPAVADAGRGQRKKALNRAIQEAVLTRSAPDLGSESKALLKELLDGCGLRLGDAARPAA